MDIIDWNPEQIAAGNAASAAAAPALERAPGAYTPLDTSGFLGSVGASFARDNWIYNMTAGDGFRHEGEADPNFNPYRAMRETWDETKRKRAEEWVRDGRFEIVGNAAELERMFSALVAEDERMKNAHASVAGSMVGGALAMALDPFTYAGVGWASRGATLASRTGRMALQSGLSQGATETALTHYQQLRTFHEAAFNIAGATVFGGGIGAALDYLPIAAFRAAEAIDAGATRAAARIRAVDAAKAEAVLSGAGEVGAARTTFADMTPEGLRADGAPTKAGGVTIMDRILGGLNLGGIVDLRSPMARLFDATANSARRVFLGLADTRGTWLQDSAGRVIATPRNAENLRDVYMATWLRGYEVDTDKAITGLSRAMAEAGVKKVDAATVNNWIQRAVTKRVDGEAFALAREALEREYGAQGADMILSVARERASELHRINRELVEPELVSLGIIRDMKRAADLKTKLEADRAARDAEVAALQQRIAVARAASKRDTANTSAEAGDALGTLERELAETRARWAREIAPTEADFRAQMAKPEPQGDNYAHAHLYDRDTVETATADFENILIEKLMKDGPDEKWLAETHGLTRDELTALRTSEPERHQAILRDWAGDERMVAVERAERFLEAAQERHRLAEADLTKLMVHLGYSNEDLARASAELRRTAAARLGADRAEATALKEVLERERQALKEAAAAARQRTADRNRMEVPTSEDTGADLLGLAMGRAREAHEAQRKLPGAMAEADLYAFLKGPGDPERAARSRQAAEAAVVRERKTGERLEDALARADAEVAPKVPEPEVSVTLARIEGRLQQIERDLAKADTRLMNAQMQAIELRRLEDNLTGAVASEREARGNLKAMVADATKTLKVSARNVGELRRAVDAAGKRPALLDVVDEIVGNVLDRNVAKTEAKGFQEVQSGRLKERRLDWTPEELERLMAAGFMRSDLPNILESQFRELSGQVALREAFNIRDGGAFSSFGSVLDTVRAEYADLRAAASGAKAKAKLTTEERDVLAALDGLHKRLLYRNFPDSQNPGVWASNKFREFAFLRYGAGFGLASLTDAAAFMMWHKFGDLIAPNYKAVRAAMSGTDHSVLKQIIATSELALHEAMTSKMVTADAELARRGIGVTGSTMHKVTSVIDAGMAKAGRGIAALSGLPLMTRYMKAAAGLAAMETLRKEVGRFGSLSAVRRNELLGLGIDEGRAARLHDFMTRYGGETNGVFDPRIEQWMGSKEGREAAKDLNIALQRDMNLSSPTPGIADTPFLMDGAVGRMFMQFQTFAFVTYNRVIAPAVQRMTVSGDLRILGLLANTMVLAAIGMAARDQINGRDFADRFDAKNANQSMLDLVDRMGMLGWSKPYVDAALKATGTTGLSSLSRNNAWQSLGGIPVEQISRMNEFVSAGFQGDTERLGKTAAILSPANTYARLFYNLLAD